MSEQGMQITTPVGRIVWGHPLKAAIKKNQQTNQPVLNDQGQQIQVWQFGVAFNRSEFEQHIWPTMAAEAATGYTQGVPQNFSWKYKDGDTAIDRNGKPYRDREGYAGCIVLTFSTELQAPGVFKFDPSTGQYLQLQAHEIKCGDYVAVGTNFKVNMPKNPTHTPGLYVNPMAVELVGYGKEIVGQGGVDPSQMFGGQQRQLPPGASLTPVGGSPGGVAMPGMGQPMQQPMMQPGQPMQQPMMQPGQPMQHQPQQPMQMAPTLPMMQPQPGQPVMQQPGQMPPPAHDYVQSHGLPPQQQMQMPGQPMGQPMQQPMMQPGQPGQPGQPMGGMPGMPGPR